MPQTKVFEPQEALPRELLGRQGAESVDGLQALVRGYAGAMGPEESPETYTVEELRRKLEVERSRGFLVLAVRRLGSRNGCGDLETTLPRSRAGNGAE